MKKIKTLLLAIGCLPIAASGQWQQHGGFAQVGTKTFLGADADIEVAGGTFKNRGTANCQNLKNNASGNLRGTGTWEILGNIENDGSLLENSKFELLGSQNSTVHSPGSPIFSLTLDKTGAGLEVNLDAPLTIGKTLKFTGVGNRLLLNNFDLMLESDATAPGANGTKFAVTNGTGRFVKLGLGTTAFNFPVGANSLTYNPLTVANSGTADDFGVRVLPDALAAGDAGAPLTTDAAATSWHLTEAVAGGSNLTLTGQWVKADELPNFVRSACAVRRWTGAVWDGAALGATTGSGTATNLYKRVRAGLTEVGYFALLDGDFPVALPPVDRSEFENDFVSQVLENQEFQVSPNPISDRTQLTRTGSFSENLLVKIVDVSGRIVGERHWTAGSESLPIHVEALPEGLFFVQILDEKGNLTETLRVVKQ